MIGSVTVVWDDGNRWHVVATQTLTAAVSIRPSVCLSICLSLYLSVCLSVCVHPSVCLSVRLSIRLFVCPSVCLLSVSCLQCVGYDTLFMPQMQKVLSDLKKTNAAKEKLVRDSTREKEELILKHSREVTNLMWTSFLS